MILSPKIFYLFFRKMLHSLKKLLNEKILKISFHIKKVIFILVARHPIPLKMTWAPERGFHRKYCFFFEKTVKLENILYLICDKKGYVNFLDKTPSVPKKLPNVPLKQFFLIFLENTGFFLKLLNKKIFAFNLTWKILTPLYMFSIIVFNILMQWQYVAVCFIYWILFSIYWTSTSIRSKYCKGLIIIVKIFVFNILISTADDAR